MSIVADRLVVRGAREHNLKGVDIDIPRDKMVVFTGCLLYTSDAADE